MNDEPRHKRHGIPTSEYIVQVANELPVDAVRMWQGVPGGRYDFGLEGEALTDYGRPCIAEQLSSRAIPVIGRGDTGYYWIPQPQYGSRPEEIIENVGREWLANGAQDEDPGGLWFALPDMSKPL